VCIRSETGEEPLVYGAASIFRELCYNYRDQFTAGIIVAGWDRQKGGQVSLSYHRVIVPLDEFTFMVVLSVLLLLSDTSKSSGILRSLGYS
jgi:hypothetical protein